jgi:HD superfamily phosphohydrolase YqeK
MSELKALKTDIDKRFSLLGMSLSEALKTHGVEPEGQVAFEQTEQGDARRQLLRVEKQAIRDKELNQKSRQSYVNSIRDMVHDAVEEAIQEQLKDKENIFLKVLGFDMRLPELLDLLAVRASSISKIEPAAANIPWLYDDLLKMVNMPKYRRTDARGKVVTVESLKVALSFLGIDNLKMVVPSMAFRRWIPQITDPYPDIKNRIWEASVGTAMSCKKIASVSKVDENSAFTVGLLHDIGKIVVTRLYFRLFEQIQREALIEAHNDKKREEHGALLDIQPSADFLIGLYDKHAYPLSAQMMKMMGFKRLFIAPAMEEFASNQAVTYMSPIGKVLAQGIAYNRYRTLKKHRMISVDEAKEYLRQFYFPQGALSVLKSTDLRHLDINMDDN